MEWGKKKMAKDTQSRKWQVTMNNPEEKGFTHDALKMALDSLPNVIYWCMADEVGAENSTYHTHIYFCCKNGVKFSRVQKLFTGGHFEPANGTSEENRNYIFKLGKWADDKKADTRLPDTQEEFGEMPAERQGARNDLTALYGMIKDGMSNFDILEANCDYMMDLDKIEKVRQTYREELYKDVWRDLEVVYIFGETGTGKTRGVMEKYGMRNVYRVTDYQHPFDSYKGQDVVVFEEFRSDLRISEMLNYLDGYALELPSRYSNKIACYTKVYMISNISLKDQYRKIRKEQPETFKAFIRRIDEVHEYEGSQIIKYSPETFIKTDDWHHFRTDGEIENILNLSLYKDAKKELSRTVESTEELALISEN